MTLSTAPSPSVTQALDTRITVRAFLDRKVEPELLRSILARAMRSPSGGNLQPWKLHVMTGDTLAAFTEEQARRTLAGELEEPTHPVYPKPLWEPQRSWRYKVGEDMYALLGIPRDNKLARLMWFSRNARFFGAPVGIIITGHKRLGAPQHMDIGILLQSIMLLAREAGLHTAPQGWWRNWTKVSHDMLDIDGEHEVLVGLAMGYGDPDAAVNGLRADRAALDEMATFYA